MWNAATQYMWRPNQSDSWHSGWGHMIRKTSQGKFAAISGQQRAFVVVCSRRGLRQSSGEMACGRVRTRPNSDRGRSSDVRPRCSRHGVGVVEGCVAF